MSLLSPLITGVLSNFIAPALYTGVGTRAAGKLRSHMKTQSFRELPHGHESSHSTSNLNASIIGSGWVLGKIRIELSHIPREGFGLSNLDDQLHARLLEESKGELPAGASEDEIREKALKNIITTMEAALGVKEIPADALIAVTYMSDRENRTYGSGLEREIMHFGRNGPDNNVRFLDGMTHRRGYFSEFYKSETPGQRFSNIFKSPTFSFETFLHQLIREGTKDYYYIQVSDEMAPDSIFRHRFNLSRYELSPALLAKFDAFRHRLTSATWGVPAMVSSGLAFAQAQVLSSSNSLGEGALGAMSGLLGAAFLRTGIPPKKAAIMAGLAAGCARYFLLG